MGEKFGIPTLWLAGGSIKNTTECGGDLLNNVTISMSSPLLVFLSDSKKIHANAV